MDCGKYRALCFAWSALCAGWSCWSRVCAMTAGVDGIVGVLAAALSLTVWLFRRPIIRIIKATIPGVLFVWACTFVLDPVEIVAISSTFALVVTNIWWWRENARLRAALVELGKAIR